MAARASGSSPLARGLQQGGHQVAGGGGIIPARAGFTRDDGRTHHGHTDHPRSRGVYLYARDDVTVLAGSSPLARGLPHHPGRRLPVPWIIPARAGFTPRGRRVLGRRGDHPRSRGVYQATAPRTLARSGSSPLARGLPMDPDGFRFYTRIIPARAGFTRRRRDGVGRRRDHPRSRGVYVEVGHTVLRRGGSSPLARGLRHRGPDADGLHRIIPARAGFTRMYGLAGLNGWDHPRSRGVYQYLSRSAHGIRGSSPLARGLLLPIEARQHRVGIIPARAGFTRMYGLAGLNGWDHPRSRGVYAPYHRDAAVTVGSSPLARGLPSSRPAPRGKRTDHPRSRGVYGQLIRAPTDETGSSPLARGLRSKCGSTTDSTRIIPARAGFTRR